MHKLYKSLQVKCHHYMDSMPRRKVGPGQAIQKHKHCCMHEMLLSKKNSLHMSTSAPAKDMRMSLSLLQKGYRCCTATMSQHVTAEEDTVWLEAHHWVERKACWAIGRASAWLSCDGDVAHEKRRSLQGSESCGWSLFWIKSADNNWFNFCPPKFAWKSFHNSSDSGWHILFHLW